jgi:ribosome-associated protein
VRGIADEIMDKMKHQHMLCYHRDGEKDYRWVVLDFLDVIVHVFDPATRDYYRLETMWGDAEEVDWQDASLQNKTGEKK